MTGTHTSSAQTRRFGGARPPRSTKIQSRARGATSRRAPLKTGRLWVQIPPGPPAFAGLSSAKAWRRLPRRSLYSTRARGGTSRRAGLRNRCPCGMQVQLLPGAPVRVGGVAPRRSHTPLFVVRFHGPLPTSDPVISKAECLRHKQAMGVQFPHGVPLSQRQSGGCAEQGMQPWRNR